MLGKYDLMAFVSTAEPSKARTFYEEKLGLEVIAADDYGVMYNVNGRRLRLSYVRELNVAPYSVLCWVVPDGTQVAWFKDPGGNVLSLAQF